MNKKTIVKLIAVLALCFLIGGALVACKGEDGKNGADGKDGTQITIVDGYWCIDGVKTDVKAEGVKGDKGDPGDYSVETCAHEWKQVCDVTVEKSVAGVMHVGTVLNVCNKCLSAKIETFDGNHTWVETDKEATCTEEGAEGGFICACGASKDATVLPKLPHTMTAEKPVLNDDANICEDGGMFAKHCTVCGYTETRTTTGEGHKVSVWNIVNDATKTAAGELEGQCATCFETVKFAVPALTETNYDLVAVAPTCVEGGSDKYTFNATKYTNDLATTKLHDDSIAAVEYSYTFNYAANGHQLAGVNYSTLYKSYTNEDTETQTAINWWKDGVAIGIQMFANEPIECDEFGHAYFICEEEDCKAIVEITAYKPHNGKSTVTKAPTCCVPGEATVACDECDSILNNQTVDCISHAYSWELKENGTKLVGTCTSACGENGELCTSVTEKIVTGATFDIITPATCYAVGAGKWTYVEGGNTYYLDVEIPTTSHAVSYKNGKYVLQSSYWNADLGKYVIKSDEDFVLYFANHEPVACGEEFEAYYVCKHEGCGKNVYIDVIQQHVYDKTQYVVASPADCENNEKRTYTCTVDGCTDPKFTEEIKGTDTGHTYTSVLYSAVKEGVAGYDDDTTVEVETYKFKLVSTCACTHVVTKYSNEATINEEKSVAATCTAPGKTVWVLDGVEVEVPEKQLAHKLAGLLVDSAEFAAEYMVSGLIKSTTPGIIYFANTEDVCGAAVNAHYNCEACKGVIYIDNVIREHKYAENLDLKCYEGTEAECTYENCTHKDTAKFAKHDIKCTVSNIVAPTATVAGSCTITIECQDENCTLVSSTNIVLPELTDANVTGDDKVYTSVIKNANGCDNKGAIEYTYNYKLTNVDNGYTYNLEWNVVFEIETAATGHSNYVAGTTKTYTLTVGEETYTVYVCDNCGLYIVVPTVIA